MVIMLFPNFALTMKSCNEYTILFETFHIYGTIFVG